MEGSERGGGGEVGRVNIVYFLSRNGKIEHPHLIRVHHLHNNGVRLRDVKRWLSELRGKDMPDSFAWSYKRRYKSGCVWQDLMDDDLIAPISDNEFVLNGSLLPPPSAKSHQFPCLHAFPCGEIEKTPKPAKEDGGHQVVPAPKPTPETLEIEPDDDDVSPKPPPRLDQESPDDSNRRTAIFKIDHSARQQEERNYRGSSSSGRCSGRASHVFRNIFTCGATETNDSALLSISRQGEVGRGGGGSQRRRASSADPTQPRHHLHQSSETNNSRKRGSTSGGKSSRRAGEKKVPAIYKPVGAPNCSQCGKAFNPEKLHSHMKSCKALKGRSKGRISLDRMPLNAESHSEEFSRESISGFLT